MKTVPVLKVIIWMFVIGAVVFSILNIFLIKNIICRPDQDNVCQQFNFLQDKSLFFTNFDNKLLAQVFKTTDGQAIQVLNYQKKLPNTLFLDIKQQDPSYRLYFQDQIFLANKKNFLATNDEQYDLLKVKLSEDYQDQVDPPQINKDLNQDLIDLTQAISDLSINEIFINGADSILTVDGLDYVFEFQAEDPLITAKKIVLMKNKISEIEEERDILLVDLRFKNPVIKFAKAVTNEGNDGNDADDVGPTIIEENND